MSGREIIDHLVIPNPKKATKIIFLVMDGVGGIAMPGKGGTELQVAKKPNLDTLAREGVCGVMDPVAPGVAPGSGPGHFAIFGYDPLTSNIGRGVLEALGIDLDLTDRDVASRGNFSTVDAKGILTDRRAGRLETSENQRIVAELNSVLNLRDEGVEIILRTVKEHRFALVLRGDALGDALEDTDPNEVGYRAKPFLATAANRANERTVRLMEKLLEQAKPVLAKEAKANCMLFRGFAKYRHYPSVLERYGLRGMAIANYPMYRGISRLLGMTLHPVTKDVKTEFEAVRDSYAKYDFFFVHVKATDRYGEDGNFDAKVKAIEEVDGLVPILTALNPDCLVVTSDHSTPAAMKKHSWHPVPVLLKAATARVDDVKTYDEIACVHGGLGHQPLTNLMGIALAHAGSLDKYGA